MKNQNMTRIFIFGLFIVSYCTAAAQQADLNFQTSIINGVVELQWNSPEQVKTYFYEVEKLNAENEWTGIKHIRSKVDEERYNTTDDNPSEGVNSYRLKFKNKYGEIFFSSISEIFFEPLTFDILIYPNPANAWLVINSDNSAAQYQVNLVNQYGTKVLSEKGENGSCVLQTSEVLEGMYYVEVEGEGASFKKTVVINHR